jgi:hypothetical protein
MLCYLLLATLFSKRNLRKNLDFETHQHAPGLITSSQGFSILMHLFELDHIKAGPVMLQWKRNQI